MIKIFFLGCLLLGCHSEKNLNDSDFKRHSVKSFNIFLSVENDTSFLGRPTSIKAVSENLLIIDKGYVHIAKVDREGNLLMKFGKQGRGPGEFQSISGFWALENQYLVYDYNSFKFSIFDLHGKLIEEEFLNKNPIDSNSKYSIPITLDAISLNKLLIPTGGREGSLFAIVDRISGEVTYTGNAVAEFVENNDQEVMHSFSKGEIPDTHQNIVMLGSSSSVIYSYQQTTRILEKYSLEGEKVWNKKIDIDAQRTLFNHIAEYNKNGGFRLFVYARAMEVRNDGVALLLNLPKDEPLTIAWVPKDGSRIDLVEVKGIKLDGDGFMEGFTISPDGQFAYYLKRSNGTIFQFDWPL